jgi:sulfite reductase (ferredoxin)
VINISGCPNSCGQHHVAHLGFFGKVAHQGDHVIPSYNVMAGAQVHDGETEFAQKVGEIAARDLPTFVKAALKGYAGKKDKYASFKDYTRSEEGRGDLKALCDAHKQIPDFETDKNYYFDWGTDKIFSVAERGKGECSAGIFDLIESDFGHIQQARKLIEEITASGGTDAQKQQFLKDIVYHSARVLLVARALESKSDQESYNFFREHFINTGLVDASFDELIKIAESKDFHGLLAKEPQVYALAERMQFLYDVMDSSFDFKIPEGEGRSPAQKVAMTAAAPQAAKEEKAEGSSTAKADVVKDFRGVGCPMNFVKTKMELAKIKPRQTLEIWLDDGAPIENVPGSVKEEGHKVLAQKKVNGGYWSVLIEKQ